MAMPGGGWTTICSRASRACPRATCTASSAVVSVRVNGGRVRPSRKLAGGDVIRVPPLSVKTRALQHINARETQRFERSIIFEDRHFLVLNKPAGAVVHGGSRHGFGVVEVSRRLRGDERFPSLVHRLDRETSGCLLLAKSPQALFEAQRIFRMRAVEKSYVALVLGQWDRSVRQVDLPLGTRPRDDGAKVCVDERHGKTSLHTRARPTTPTGFVTEW